MYVVSVSLASAPVFTLISPAVADAGATTATLPSLSISTFVPTGPDIVLPSTVTEPSLGIVTVAFPSSFIVIVVGEPAAPFISLPPMLTVPPAGTVTVEPPLFTFTSTSVPVVSFLTVVPFTVISLFSSSVTELPCPVMLPPVSVISIRVFPFTLYTFSVLFSLTVIFTFSSLSSGATTVILPSVPTFTVVPLGPLTVLSPTVIEPFSGTVIVAVPSAPIVTSVTTFLSVFSSDSLSLSVTVAPPTVTPLIFTSPPAGTVNFPDPFSPMDTVIDPLLLFSTVALP